MASIAQRQFAGIRPAVADRNVDPRYATRAHNVVLRDSSLKAIRTDTQVLTTAARTVLRLPDNQTCCGPLIAWPSCVFPLVGMPAPKTCHEFDQIVIFPQRCEGEPQRYLPCVPEYAPLVVPAPRKVLSLTRLATGALETHPYAGPDARAYTYTWVDKFGIESPPALPSMLVKSYDDERWRLSNFDTPPAHAVAVNIYRTSSFMETGEAIPIAPQTSYQLVEQVPLPLIGGVYVDSRKLIDLDYGTLQTEDNCPPPCMEQVFNTQSGYAVGWSGNDIYFSERYEPHNWPTRYRTTLPHRIVGLAVTGDFVFVGTTGQPFRINTAPAIPANQQAVVDLTIDPLPYDENYPCLGRHTLVSTSFGAMYVTHKGLVALQPKGAAQLISRDRIDEDDWMGMAPNLAAWHNGKYIGVRAPAGDGMVFDVRDGAEGNLDMGDFVTVDLPAVALHSGRDGFLYYAHRDGGVFRWAHGPELREYTYVSKIHRLPGVVGMLALKIVGAYGPPVGVEIYVDGRLAYTGQRTNSKPKRLPPIGRGLEYQIKLTGTTQVHEWHLATSVADLVEEIRQQ